MKDHARYWLSVVYLWSFACDVVFVVSVVVCVGAVCVVGRRLTIEGLASSDL